ncbi:hypothetical protein [Mammaliicoccus sciuri]|uniref:hypothetical protein n=1 Tax=Mammaliicoccus sciuri TaxID=1296 RepID=UPI003F54EBB7
MDNEKFEALFKSTWDEIANASFNDEHIEFLNKQVDEMHPDLNESEKRLMLLSNYNTGFTQTLFKEFIRKLLVNDSDS